MRIGITKFPGTNNELDVKRVLSSLGIKNELIYPDDVKKMNEMDALILAGGFSYGDYLRPGIIAVQTPVIENLLDYSNSERFVIGICNGFQMLCETSLLPGVLSTNTSTKFISKWVNIKTGITSSPLLKGMENKILKIPIAHFECRKDGKISLEENPNGSVENIAGIVNRKGNVLGMMPHPERASFQYLGSEDGRIIFKNLIGELKC
ncbi:MAG: phosphoribosylformylglycinamidine synthase subunit PurQ [Candidatus Heimdallarchaeaceae archaeon]|jgi:phosphoribosylformylglycinamidine synthase